MRSSFGCWLGARPDLTRARCALHGLAACSVSTTAREILVEWRWVSLHAPPHLLKVVSALATILYLGYLALALLGSSLDVGHGRGMLHWLSDHPFIPMIGAIFGCPVIYRVTLAVGCAVANSCLFLVRAILFPSSADLQMVLPSAGVLARPEPHAGHSGLLADTRRHDSYLQAGYAVHRHCGCDRVEQA